MAEQEYRRLTREELDALAGEPLPERAAMSLVNANLAAPINAALALNVLSDNPDRDSIEKLLNSSPPIVQQFGVLAQRAGGTLRTIISTATGFDASV